MICSLYTYELQDNMRSQTRFEDKTLTVLEKQKLTQDAYYKRRGFFNAYVRKVALKTKTDLQELKKVAPDLEGLEAFSSKYIKEHFNVELVNGRATAYLLRAC